MNILTKNMFNYFKNLVIRTIFYVFIPDKEIKITFFYLLFLKKISTYAGFMEIEYV